MSTSSDSCAVLPIFAGGTDIDHRFLRNMSTANCGKLAALEHLLRLWSTKGDKVNHSYIVTSIR